VLGIRDGREQDQSVGARRAELLDQIDDPVAQQVVAQIHDEGRVAQERLGGEHRVGQAKRRVLLDVLDRDAEGAPVAGGLTDLGAGLGGDDDPDLLDPGRRHRLDAVEEHRLVGHRHELLGAGVGQRAQAGSLPAGQDQAAHR
jgi:hypothetical protein